MRRRTLVLAGLGAAAAGVGLGLAAWSPEAAPDPRLPLPLGAMDWRLTDHTGRRVRPADWLGRPALVFFGFTHCPEVCPTTLADIAGWLEALGPAADALTVAFVTVDPERDTPAVLARYVAAFGPRIAGLTGSAAEVRAAADAFRATYERVPAGDGYTMNHTAGVFLFDASGRFAGIVDYHESRRFALPKIRRILPADAPPGT